MKPERAERAVMISVEEPRPFLDEGEHFARCTTATVAWSRRWKKWIVRLVMEPLNYTGRPYSGELCKFLSLGIDPKKPRAGQASRFRTLWVEVNGAQPTQGEVDLEMFVGHVFHISVRTVKAKADKEKTPIPPEHWYSIVDQVTFCKSLPRTLEHLQHANTNNTGNTGNTPTLPTREPFNPLTLTEPSNTSNPLTPRVPVERGKKGANSVSSLESIQQTHRSPEGDGDAETNVSPSSSHAIVCIGFPPRPWPEVKTGTKQ